MSSPGFFSPAEKSANGLTSEGEIRCYLCPRLCRLAPGRAGLCQVRLNKGGKPEIPFYGFVTALALDPIEKKPLYHFRPGSQILSAGFAGCNLHCPFCQNWHISQNVDVPGRFYTPEELVAAALKSGKAAMQSGYALHSGYASQSLAYTYSEPLVHIEFLLDCMKEARKAGVANVIVSNGCINSDAAEEVLGLCDAANIDLKCFSEESYSKVLGGSLSTVKNFLRMAVKKGVHLEITTLVVPGFSDSEEELNACADFIADLSELKISGKSVIPWHLSAYHPDWKWKAPPTSPRFLAEAADRARKNLAYVYTGNVAGEKNNTLCPHCGKTLISRRGYRVDTSGLSIIENDYYCATCGKKAPIAI